MIWLLFLSSLLPKWTDQGLAKPYWDARLIWGLDTCPKVDVVEWCEDYDPQCEGLVGFYQHDGKVGTIWLRRDLAYDPDSLLSTMVHEMGHSLWIEHTEHGVMSSDWTRPLAIMPSKDQLTEAKKSCYR